MSKSVAKMRPWFKNGLKFSCVQCGRCCLGTRTNVFVNPSEMKALAEAKGMSMHSFVQNFTEEREISTAGGEKVVHTSLKNSNGACSLLSSDRKTCTVNDAKPTQCKNYPFGWPNVVVGEAEWGSEAQRCPGINGENSQLRTKEEIVKSLLVGLVHNRGAGEDWTYEEASELLSEADELEGGNMLANFEEDFFSRNRSVIVHESAKLRVVDATTAATDGSDQAETFRRLEFRSSASLTQTEVPLDSFGQPDHSRLVLDVHKLMASLVKARLSSLSTIPLTRDGGGESNPRMVLVGGGAGALSSHLVSLPDLSQLTVDVVEPEAEVSAVAKDFFGAKYDFASRVRLHEATGEDYLLSQVVDDSVDVMVVDAADSLPLSFFTGRKSDDTREHIAPPPSLLQAPVALVKCLTANGVTLINFMGDTLLLTAMHAIITKGLQAEGCAYTEPVVLVPSYIPNKVILLARASAEPEVRRLTRALLEQEKEHHMSAFTIKQDPCGVQAATLVPY